MLREDEENLLYSVPINCKMNNKRKIKRVTCYILTMKALTYTCIMYIDISIFIHIVLVNTDFHKYYCKCTFENRILYSINPIFFFISTIRELAHKTISGI